MRCLSCNCALSDHEATRKYATSGTFIDLCDGCFSTVADEIPSMDGAPPEEADGNAYDSSDSL